MIDSELRAIETGNICYVHKVILHSDGTCSDCQNEIPAWKPTKRTHYSLHEFPFGVIWTCLWWAVAAVAIVYFGFGVLFGWR
jgi:hypothetical protein